MLSVKGVLAGLGAVVALYIVAFLGKTYGYKRETATGLGLLAFNAMSVLLHPLFWLGVVVVFFAAAMWVKKS